MKVLGIITARGGSKGVPGKNLKPLGGKPLLFYTVDAAVDTAVDRLILSTDDPKIADAGRALGCEVPFMRPPELARDETPHLPVIQHAVQWLKEHDGYAPDVVVTLQPTSPLRSAIDISGALRMLELSGADSVVSVTEVSAHAHPMRMLRLDAQGDATLFVTGEPVRKRINRRQDLPPAFVMNGAVYACRTHVLFGDEPSLYGNRVVAYPMPPDRSISIDSFEDWAEAEAALARQPRDHHHHHHDDE
jgi:CMP-N,N'-diacetyllegionaminic acid synthase